MMTKPATKICGRCNRSLPLLTAYRDHPKNKALKMNVCLGCEEAQRELVTTNAMTLDRSIEYGK
jgi:hypothetical protein